MKKLLTGVFASLLAISLAGCGEDAVTKELDAKDTNKAEAKTGDGEAKEAAADPEEKKDEEIWTYYDNAKWSEDFNGLKLEIQKAVVTDIAPTMEDENAKASAVGVKFRIENTTDGKFTTYPDQAVLVTSTGEQIDMPDMWVSDDLGGEIDKGVIKEGNVIWYLERGEAEKIEWIKVSFNARPGGEDELNDSKDFEIELKLK